MSENNLIKRLAGIQAVEPRYNSWGLTVVTKEAMDAIKVTAGEAEILIHRLAFMCCDMCGVCPKEQQDPFDCEIIGTGGQS